MPMKLSPHSGLKGSNRYRHSPWRRKKKSKPDALPPGPKRLGARLGSKLRFKNSTRPLRLCSQTQRGDTAEPSTPPPLSSRHSQGLRPRARPGRARPGRARPAISSPVIRSQPRSGLDSPPHPPQLRHVPLPHTRRPPPSASGEERLEGRRARNPLSTVPHLWVEKGHTARFGIVLIRAVRHLGVKSLLPLHAGRKRFTLPGLGRGGGRARGEREPRRRRRGPPPPSSPAPVTPPLSPPPSEGAGFSARARKRSPAPDWIALCCTALGTAEGSGRGPRGSGAGLGWR